MYQETVGFVNIYQIKKVFIFIDLVFCVIDLNEMEMQILNLFYFTYISTSKWISDLNTNKAGLFESSFFWGGGQYDPPLHISRRTNLISI